MKNIEILSIGDELLIGQVVNTNASWMGNLLTENGMAVNRITAISDSKPDILNSLNDAKIRSKLVLVTGGLGPTSDDITKPTVCEFFETTLVENAEVVENIRGFFNRRNIPLTELNRKQAEVPANCKVIHNPKGTAPGMHFEKDGTHFIFMPGVPYEMKFMMENYVIDLAKSLFTTSKIVKTTILTHGMGESFLADRIKNWENSLPKFIKLAYLPSPGMVRLRLTAYGDSESYLQNEVQKQVDLLLNLIPELVYGFDNDTLENVVGKLLLEKGLTISTAESCTGGNIAHLITSIPGSSKYFKGSVIAYANAIKTELLNVNPLDIENYGAVSEQVVTQMAQNVRKLLKTDVAVATSGIAGPNGGTDEKPIGTIWIAVATQEKIFAKKFQFGEDRLLNIQRASLAALDMVRKMI